MLSGAEQYFSRNLIEVSVRWNKYWWHLLILKNAVVAVEESCVLDVKSGTVLIISSGRVLLKNCSLKARYLFCKWKYRLPFIVQRILSLWISAKDLNIPVQFRQLSFSFLQVPVFCGCQLGDYFPNQVASTKILAAMAPKVVTAWRVVIPSRSVVVRNIIWNKLCRIRFVYDLFFFFFFVVLLWFVCLVAF